MWQLRKLSDLNGFKIDARDGEIGNLKQIYFDDQSWVVRYFVVHTGSWLLGRDVLIVPSMILSIDHEKGTIAVKLTRNQVEHAPPIETEQPVSRHYEQEYYSYYNWEPYWPGGPISGTIPPASPFIEPKVPGKPENPHLRSSDEVAGYHIKTTDDGIGHVEDYILDDRDWTIRYLEIDTRNWLPGIKVLVSPAWIEDVDWVHQEVSINLSRELIKTAPEYDSDKIISRDYELALYKHYGKALHQK